MALDEKGLAMFANPLWSVLIIVGLIVMYAIIRFKHEAPLLSTSQTWWEWIIAFRTWVAAWIAGLLLALPDILVLITPFDFSPWIGSEYAKLVTLAFGIFAAINASLKTRPVDVPVDVKE